ncbi:hypothetical protein I3271_04905 [Photobacterium leiognathi]|uniref:hypothetical protein n=1 Tax=Photobacterium leiognathi TaxID=553611 RepID=UPI001EDF2160|nr:hypothetical protein [Photobacterium leiognathi]MCG3884023.1 hypothetical protein [Photobacterium leiognathi]
MKKSVLFLLFIVSGCATTQKDKDFEEVTFYVPKDYNNMSSGKIKLNAMIHRAKDKKNRIGFLVLNFGGPGGEAVESATNMISENRTPQYVTDRFDVLAIDPKGTGKSEFLSDARRSSFNNECNNEKESMSFNISTMKITQNIDYIGKLFNEDKCKENELRE